MNHSSLNSSAEGKRKVYVSTTLQHFLAPVGLYSPDCQIARTVYRRLDLAYFAYLYRAFRRAQRVYLETNAITDSQWQLTRSRWSAVIAMAFDHLNLHSASEDELAALMIAPDAHEPQYEPPPKQINIFTAHSDYAGAYGTDKPRGPERDSVTVGTPATTTRAGRALRDYQTQTRAGSKQKGLF